MTRKQTVVCLVLLWGAICAPIFILDVFPAVDWPNHLARIHVLAHFSEGYAAYYKPHWTLLPNLGVDAIMVPLARIMPTPWAGKVFLCLVFGVQISGFAALNRAYTGRFSAWSLLGASLCFNYILGFGFVNYLLGLGLTLWAIAITLLLRPKPKLRLWVVAIFATALWLCHLMAGVIFSATLLALELGRKAEAHDRIRRTEIVSVAVSLIVPAALLMLSTTGHAESAVMRWDTVERKLQWFLMPLWYGNALHDGLYFGLFALVLFSYWRFRQLKLRAGTQITIAGFIALFWVLPFAALTSAFIDARLPIFGLFVGLALIRFEPKTQAFERAFIVLAVLFPIVRSIDAAARLLPMRATENQIASDLSGLQRPFAMFQIANRYGRSLLPYAWDPSVLHRNCLALLNGPSYVANLFTIPQQQPLIQNPKLPGAIRDIYRTGSMNKHIERFAEDAASYVNEMGELGPPNIYVYYIKPLPTGRHSDHDTSVPLPDPKVATLIVDRPRYAIWRIPKW